MHKVNTLNRKYISSEHEVEPTVHLMLEHADRDVDSGTRHYVQTGWRDGAAVLKVTFWCGGVDITFYVACSLVRAFVEHLNRVKKGHGLADGMDLMNATLTAALNHLSWQDGAR